MYKFVYLLASMLISITTYAQIKNGPADPILSKAYEMIPFNKTIAPNLIAVVSFVEYASYQSATEIMLISEQLDSLIKARVVQYNVIYARNDEFKRLRIKITDNAEKLKANYQTYLDSSGQLMNTLKMKSFPTTLLIDRQGNIVYRQVGPRNKNNWDSLSLVIGSLHKPVRNATVAKAAAPLVRDAKAAPLSFDKLLPLMACREQGCFEKAILSSGYKFHKKAGDIFMYLSNEVFFKYESGTIGVDEEDRGPYPMPNMVNVIGTKSNSIYGIGFTTFSYEQSLLFQVQMKTKGFKRTMTATDSHGLYDLYESPLVPSIDVRLYELKKAHLGEGFSDYEFRITKIGK